MPHSRGLKTSKREPNREIHIPAPANQDSSERDAGRPQRLPQLRSAKRVELPSQIENIPEMRSHATKATRMKATMKLRPRTLTLLDEQMLVLCQSAIGRSWGISAPTEREQGEQSHTRVYGHESIYAATQIQRLFRGFRTRRILAQLTGPKFQRAARAVQFALRRVLVARRVFQRWMFKRHRAATCLQAWYRGTRCRDMLQYERARFVTERIRMFQRRFRGYRFWNLVTALLHQRRSNASTEIQRCYRGMAARRRVNFIRLERQRFALELRQRSDAHRTRSRCPGCHSDTGNEQSLFECFMVRFIGLHDYGGAKTLGEEGVRDFPTSARFSFMFAVLLQAMGEDLETSMAFLRRAQLILSIREEDVAECERRYLLPALQLCKDDISVLLDLAIISQSTGNLNRAQTFYELAFRQTPKLYAIPGYLHRADMLDRLLLNYHRFCSVFSARQVNIFAKTVPVAKRGEQVRLMVARMHQFIVITPAEEGNLCRFNTLYLTDEEVFQLLVEKEQSTQSEDGDENSSTRTLLNLRSHNQRRSARQGTMSELMKASKPNEDVRSNEPSEQSIVQRFQTVFVGLDVSSAKLSRASEERSRLRITRELAEKILQEIMFVDVHPDQSTEHKDSQAMIKPSTVPESIVKVMIAPAVLKNRSVQWREFVECHAALNVQRTFRGFRVRARFRRQRVMKAIHQQQVDDLYARLHHNFMARERRRLGAIAMQRIYKGYATRQRIKRWRAAAIDIQRIYRGSRGRKRAIAFREGNLTFFMAERVYQRGICLRDRMVMMLIDRCGLSFKLEAYDLSACTMYPGFVSHDSTVALIRYENWAYAQQLCGRDLWLHGSRGTLMSVAFIDSSDCQCVMTCDFGESHGPMQGGRLVPLVDCIQAINLRNIGTKGNDAEQLPLPMTLDDTSRIVACLVDRLTLIDALPMATKELKKKSPGHFIVTVVPPPKVHFLFSKIGKTTIEYSKMSNEAAKTEVTEAMRRQLAFPIVDGYRGRSVGARQFRRKCDRHAVHFTKCRCVLPLVSTPAYIDTLALAMSPASSSIHNPSDESTG